MPREVPVTVVETPEFIAATEKLLSDEERALLVEFLAYNPMAGEIVPGTGGVRKVRWALPGRGKSGGARVIYFYYNSTVPLFALTAYAKNQRANLSHQDRNDFRRMTKVLVESYGRTNQ